MSTSSAPMLSIWFGNFFEPFYSSREAVSRGLKDVVDLGFNSVNLDSKPWEDFFARYRGQPASNYVAMQEFMMQEIQSLGLDYTHLALYLGGDNLYPNIRDVPPVRGEESIRPDGQPMGTYKYWSPKAQATMVEHVRGLLALYSTGMRRTEETPPRIIMQTMFEPIPKPSFDAEGRTRYLGWLARRYGGDIGRLNQRYGTNAESFEALAAGDYYLRPEELNWVDCARPTALDFARRTPDFYRWVDNQTYLAGELQQYLAVMKEHWRRMDPPIFIQPVLHQWGFFFNPPGQISWQTGQRAMDVYKCADHVDSVLYIASPLNAENQPDAMALSVEGSIMRSANSGRPFTGGLYMGRHVNADIYRTVTPAESIGTLIANGATSFHIYGYSGLDDGGVMYRMDGPFKESLRAGNKWAAKVIPMLLERRAREAAILFPAEMSLYEPLEVDAGGQHRMDLLGWYAQLVDLGWHVDILHPRQIASGALADYSHLVVPHCALYDLGPNAASESAIKAFVMQGGTLLHGPHCEVAANTFGVHEVAAPFDCIQWRESVIPHGWSTVAYLTGTPIGAYIQSGQPAITEIRAGAGRIFSFGFQYGYSYCRRTMPIVPPHYGRQEMHPIVLLEKTPVEVLIGSPAALRIRPMRGVEFARFGNQLIVVNHRSSPVDISEIKAHRAIPQLPAIGATVAGHSATCLTLAPD